MNRYIAVFLIIISFTTAFANPLIGNRHAAPKADSIRVAKPTYSTGPSFKPLLKLQREIRFRMHKVNKKLKTKEGFITFCFLIFLYGLVHALGPGHGKLFIIGYFSANPMNRIKRVRSTFLIGIVHAISTFLLLMVLKGISNLSVIKHSDSIIRFAQLSSFALIIIVAVSMIVNNLTSKKNRKLTFWTLVLAIGIVPCPATLLVINYLMLTTNDFVKIIIATLSIGLGMSLSLTIFSLLPYGAIQKTKLKDTKWLAFISPAFMIVIAIFSIIVFAK